MLTIYNIENTITETERFLKIAKRAADKMHGEKTARLEYCKESSALRRASMDLTRELAHLRKRN
jgi:hypothetical protein